MNDLKFEAEYWGKCGNTFDEEQKHYVYAHYMGIERDGYWFNCRGASVIDIGGGPVSMTLKSRERGMTLVVDPLRYPDWIYSRYQFNDIDCLVRRGEDIDVVGFDECWIYNCLQHTDDPEKVIRNGMKSAKVLRIFEWVDIEPHDGHPHMLTKENLDKWTASSGNVVYLGESGCYGKAYYNVVKI